MPSWVVGSAGEVNELCREIRKRGDGPDFIAVDGNEGGSGAAPLALADYVGLPLVDALIAVDDARRREGLRDDVTVIASGKIATGGEVATHLALGADLVHIGRGFLFSIGCIQAMRCHTNTCPTGVTTQNRWLQSGLDPTDKGVRVRNYAFALERDVEMITHACGLTHPIQLHRSHVVMNISPGVRKSLVELFPYPSNQSGLPTISKARIERESRVAASRPSNRSVHELEKSYLMRLALWWVRSNSIRDASGSEERLRAQ